MRPKFRLLLQKTVAFCLFIFLSLDNTRPLPSSYAQEPSSETFQNISANLHVPAEWGRIEEVKILNPSRTVVIIQDAHAVPEAQIHILQLINYFQERFHVQHIGLEGAEGPLDPTLFRALPDSAMKERIFKDYLKQGDLSGPEVAAILNKGIGNYFGLEDWKSYVADYEAYLKVLDQQVFIEKWVSSRLKMLNRFQGRIFNYDQRELYNLIQSFEQNKVEINNFFEILNRFGKKYAASYLHDPRFKTLKRTVHSKDQADLGRLLRSQNVWQEMHDWLKDIEGRIFQDEEAAALFRKYKDCHWIRGFSRLELSRNEYLQDKPVSAIPQKIREHLQSAEFFYQIALQREAAFYEHLRRVFQKNDPKIILAVVGGFHTQGLIRELERNNISRVVISPRITSLIGEEYYAAKMRGQWSYGSLISKKGCLQEAFTKHALNQIRNFVTLGEIKQWRDQLLQDLATQNHLERAYDYTHWLDEAVGNEKDHDDKRKALIFLEREFENIKRKNLSRIWGRFKSQVEEKLNVFMPVSKLAPLRTALRPPWDRRGAAREKFLLQLLRQRLHQRSEVRYQQTGPLTFQMTWTDLPEFEKRRYAASFDSKKAEKIYQEVAHQPASSLQQIRITLGGEKLEAHIVIDQRLKDKGLDIEIFRSVIEKGFEALASQDEKAALREILNQTTTGKPLVLGLIPRKDNKWQSKQIISFSPEKSLVGINEYVFEMKLEEAILTTQLFNALLRPYRQQIGQALVNPDRDQAFYDHPRVGGEGELKGKVRAWYRQIEFKRYNVNQETADLFVESYREEYGFISEETTDYPVVYKTLREIVSQLLIAEGYDPQNFQFHFADYLESNAYVMRFANHIVLNLGLLSKFMWLLMDYEPDQNFFYQFFGNIFTGKTQKIRRRKERLRNFYREHIASVLAHEISHLKQYRDLVNEGKQPVPETMEMMHERMQKSAFELAKEKGEDFRQVYAREIDADRYALEIMDRAGMSVKESHLFFQLSYLDMKDRGRSETIFGDHPLLVERVKNIRREVKSKYFEHYDAPLVPFVKPEETIDQSTFYQELLLWNEKTPRQTRMKRSHKKEFSNQVMAIDTREDFAAALAGVRDWDDLKLLVTIGYVSLFIALSETSKKRQTKIEKKFEPWNRKLAAFIKAHEKEDEKITVVTQWEHPSQDPEDGLFYREPVLSGDANKIDRNQWVDFLISYFTAPGKLRLYRTRRSTKRNIYFTKWYQHRVLDKLAEELQGLLDEWAQSLEIPAVVQSLQPLIQAKIKSLGQDRPASSIPSLKEFYPKIFIRRFHGQNHLIPQALSSPSSKARLDHLRDVLRQVDKEEFKKRARHLLGDQGTTPKILDYSKSSEQKLNFIGRHNMADVIPTATQEVIQIFQQVFRERQAEFSLDESFQIFHELVKESVIYSLKFRGSRPNEEALFEILLTLIQRMRDEKGSLKEGHLQALLDFWKQYPHFLGTKHVHKDDKYFAVGDFFKDFFILDAKNFIRFKKDIQMLVGKTAGKIYFSRTDVKPDRVESDEAPDKLQEYDVIISEEEKENKKPEIIKEGEPEEEPQEGVEVEGNDELAEAFARASGTAVRKSKTGQKYVYVRNITEFSINHAILALLKQIPIGAHPLLAPDAADAFMELFDLYAGFITEGTTFEVPEMVAQRLRLFHLIEEIYGLTQGARQLLFYENVLQKARERETIPLFLAVDRFKVHGGYELIKPLPYFLMEQMQHQLQGHLSVLEARVRYLIEEKRKQVPETFLDYMSGESDIGILTSYEVDGENAIKMISGSPYWFQFGKQVSRENISNPLLKKVYLELQDAKERMMAHQKQWVQKKAQQLNLGEDFLKQIDRLHPEVIEYMYLFGIGGFISYRHFYQALHKALERWSEQDFEALAIFLNALTPEQKDRKFTPNNKLSAQSWEEYLVPLGLFLLRKKFGMAGSWSFHSGLQQGADNPFQILFGEIPYQNYKDNKLFPEGLAWQVMKAVRKSRTKSTDRYHFPHLRKMELVDIWTFIDQHPEITFEAWLEFAKTRLPKSSMRNLFLYHVLWSKKIAPRLNLGSREAEMEYYYEWHPQALERLSDLAQNDPDFVRAVSQALSLMTKDHKMYSANQQGAGDIIRTMSDASREHENRVFNKSEIVGSVLGMIAAAGIWFWPLPLFHKVAVLTWMFVYFFMDQEKFNFGFEKRPISVVPLLKLSVKALFLAVIYTAWFYYPVIVSRIFTSIVFLEAIGSFRFLLFLAKAALWFFTSFWIILILSILAKAAQKPTMKHWRKGIAFIIVWAVTHFSSDERIRKMIDLIRNATDHPGVMIGAFQGIKKMIDLEYYEKLRNYQFIRFWLKIYFKYMRRKENVPRVPWQFNEPGNIHSQTDVFTGHVFKPALLSRASKQMNFIETKEFLKEVRRFFPRTSPVRDEVLMDLTDLILQKDNPMDSRQKLALLNFLLGKKKKGSRASRSWFFQLFFHEQVALDALQLAVQLEEGRTGQPILFRKEKNLVLAYFPDFSFTRDDILLELLERAEKPLDYRALYRRLITAQENVTQEEVRDKVFAENKVRAYIQSSSNHDKEEFALWLMGLQAEKPFIVQEIEYATLMDLDFLLELLNPYQKKQTRYPTVGRQLKADMVETLFGGDTGLVKDPGTFFHFLNKVFESKVPKKIKNRAKVKRIFMTIFRYVEDEKKLEILKAMSYQLTPGREVDIGLLVKSFFQSMGIIGIKMAQYLVHSDIELDPQIQAALEGLSSSADLYSKKYVYQFLGLVFRDNFDEHFEGVLNQLGSASIKIVYELLHKKYKNIVLKLKRPEIDKVVEEELNSLGAILKDLVSWQISFGGGVRRPLQMPEDIATYIRQAIYEEVDFILERQNRQRFHQLQQERQKRNGQSPQNMIGNRRILFSSPQGIPELDAFIPTTLQNQAMFEIKVTGFKLKELEQAGNPLGLTAEDVRLLKRAIFEDLMEQMFRDGLFHADPHGGNIWVKLAENGWDLEVVYLDLGSMGRNELLTRREEVEMALGPVSDAKSLRINGKPLIELIPIRGMEEWVMNPYLTREDFTKDPASATESMKKLLVLWSAKQKVKREKSRQLASWVLYQALHKGAKPYLSKENFLEARFFKEIWYIMRDIPPLDIARLIFNKLEIPFPEKQADQIRAIRLASEGNRWEDLQGQRYEAGLLDRIFSAGLDFKRAFKNEGIPSDRGVPPMRSELRSGRSQDIYAHLVQDPFSVLIQKEDLVQIQKARSRSELRRYLLVTGRKNFRGLLKRQSFMVEDIQALLRRFRENTSQRWRAVGVRETRRLFQEWRQRGWLLMREKEIQWITSKNFWFASPEPPAAIDLSEVELRFLKRAVHHALRAMESKTPYYPKMDLAILLPNDTLDQMILKDTFEQFRSHIDTLYLLSLPGHRKVPIFRNFKAVTFDLSGQTDQQKKRLNDISRLLGPDTPLGLLVQEEGVDAHTFLRLFTSVTAYLHHYNSSPHDGIRLKKAVLLSALAILRALSLLDKGQQRLALHDENSFKAFVAQYPDLEFVNHLWGIGPEGLSPRPFEEWVKTLEAFKTVSIAS